MGNIISSHVNDFLNYVDKEKLQLKRSSKEMEDITAAVNEAVDSFAAYLGKKYPIFEISHKYAVGSMAEGTKILEADEFDFILVLKQFNEHLLDIKQCEECCFERLTDVERELEFMFEGFRHAHVSIPNRKHSQYDEDMRGKSPWNVFLSKPSDFLDGDETLLGWNFKKVCKDSGDLTYLKDSRFVGPSWNLMFLWKTKQGADVKISVDTTMAIEITHVTDIVTLQNIPCKTYYQDLVNEDKCFIIPKVIWRSLGEYSANFKYNFTTTEVNIMRNLSEEHKVCYRILKYIYRELYSLWGLQSYFLKMLILRHAPNCYRRDPAKCLEAIFRDIDNIITKRNDDHGVPEFEIETLFIRKMKLKNSIPSYHYDDLVEHQRRIQEQFEKLKRIESTEYEIYFQNFVQGIVQST